MLQPIQQRGMRHAVSRYGGDMITLTLNPNPNPNPSPNPNSNSNPNLGRGAAVRIPANVDITVLTNVGALQSVLRPCNISISLGRVGLLKSTCQDASHSCQQQSPCAVAHAKLRNIATY